jgi:hypothetical protein
MYVSHVILEVNGDFFIKLRYPLSDFNEYAEYYTENRPCLDTDFGLGI